MSRICPICDKDNLTELCIIKRKIDGDNYFAIFRVCRKCYERIEKVEATLFNKIVEAIKGELILEEL